MKTHTLNINHKKHTVLCDGDKPLLWVLRDDLKLMGAKYGCGIGQCGACTVHIDGNAVRACLYPISSIGDKKVTTVEGLAKTTRDPILMAYEKYNVPQCGYCQTGQMMTIAFLLKTKGKPSDEDIDNAMSGNICRCGTYYRIRKAIKAASTIMME